MRENTIPERWQGHYACIVDGEVEDAQLEQQLMEELGAAEARIRELEQALECILYVSSAQHAVLLAEEVLKVKS